MRGYVMKMLKKIILLVTVLLPMSVVASDLAKEKRWADQVVDSIMDGDAVWLNDGKSKFLTIYTEAGDASARAAIIMHGTGIHPDWQQVVQPLRVGLTEHKWNTLSIQMPVLANEANYSDYAPLYDEVAPRVNAAIKFLRDRGINEIVLIGHSQGSAMAAYYLSSTQQPVKGFVAIGMSAFAKDRRMNSIRALEKIKVPVFDLYGSDDLKIIIDSARSRAAAAEKNKHYIQQQNKGNHFFDGEEDALVSEVAAWLEGL